MTSRDYERLSAPFRKNPLRMKLIVSADKILTGIVFAAYPLLLLRLFLEKNPIFLRSVLVPLLSLIIITLFRSIYSAKRPYELLEIEPLITKDTVGKSFPSKHVFSVFIIGMTFFYIDKGAGVAIGAIGVLMGAVRVIGGVHFPKDVTAGALAGIFCGLMGYFMPL